jgi:hypothetical protein
MQDSPSPSPRGQLSDPAFRADLLSKLDSLLAVLEIARSKAENGVIARPGESRRLLKLQVNLEKTLDICRQARRALKMQERAEQCCIDESGFRQFVESASFREFIQMRAVSPITNDEVLSADLDQLCQRLFESKNKGS